MFEPGDRVQHRNRLGVLGTVLTVGSEVYMRYFLHIRWDDNMESDEHPSDVRKASQIEGPYPI